MRKQLAFMSLITSLVSCGYHYAPVEKGEDAITISIPYISGDLSSVLNNELVYQLSETGQFQSVQTGGNYTLKVLLLSDTQDRIGFRYDRDNNKGKLEKNLLGVESRRTVSAEVSLIDSRTEKVVIGPYDVSASVDYDYIDPGSPQDALYTFPSGKSESTIQFSLGQLDSYEGAFDSASYLVFRKLAEKIVKGVLTSIPKED